MKAIWNSAVIAESDDTVVVEGNHYFPLSAVNESYLKSSKNFGLEKVPVIRNGANKGLFGS